MTLDEIKHDLEHKIETQKDYRTQIPKDNVTQIILTDQNIHNFVWFLETLNNLKPNESKTINRNENAEEVLKDFTIFIRKKYGTGKALQVFVNYIQDYKENLDKTDANVR